MSIRVNLCDGWGDYGTASSEIGVTAADVLDAWRGGRLVVA